MLVCRKNDNSVPDSSTKNIYEVLKKQKHLLELNEGVHGTLLWKSEGSRYQDCVHAFYKFYGLPCNEKFAQRGQKTFEETIDLQKN